MPFEPYATTSARPSNETGELNPQDEARARLARARAASRLRDYAVVEEELTRALGPARAAQDAAVLRELQTLLGRRRMLAATRSVLSPTFKRP